MAPRVSRVCFHRPSEEVACTWLAYMAVPNLAAHQMLPQEPPEASRESAISCCQFFSCTGHTHSFYDDQWTRILQCVGLSEMLGSHGAVSPAVLGVQPDAQTPPSFNLATGTCHLVCCGWAPRSVFSSAKLAVACVDGPWPSTLHSRPHQIFVETHY